MTSGRFRTIHSDTFLHFTHTTGHKDGGTHTSVRGQQLYRNFFEHTEQKTNSHMLTQNGTGLNVFKCIYIPSVTAATRIS